MTYPAIMETGKMRDKGAAERLERAARFLRECPQPDQHEAVIELLAMAILDVARTSPAQQADRVAAIARAMG